MAHKMLKPYSWLCYLLVPILFFFIGLSLAGFVGAGKGQGLAAGAIVLGYGVIGAAIGIVIALLLTSHLSRKTLIRLNGIVALSIAFFYGYYHIRYKARDRERAQEEQLGEPQRSPTGPTTDTP
ncbi:hypothetical protein [Pareuzebyella sediminis]|uniref:hypothetical protein n=1 Tax=Pareuzebyella sediminis TaxID=2607998 RepID=UPI0011F033FA|nr:hypothetical protein [Pareuzebyella sediminis]